MVRRHKAIWLLCLLMAAGLTMTFSASALGKAPINTDDRGVTIKGYDTVAYFTKGKPVKGMDEFSFEWKGAKWLFSSREHMELFVKNPEKYAPRYGGFRDKWSKDIPGNIKKADMNWPGILNK